MKDLVSVIVPVYNVEKYLENCVNSIVSQTYSNLEIILVDDGSTDNSGKLCDKLAQSDKRIKVIHKKNGGLSDARNAGIKVANGKYITFVDSDDDITSDYVEYLYNLIKKDNSKLSICSYTIVASKKKINIGSNYKNETFSTKECLKRMLCAEGFDISAWAKLYDRKLFDNVEFPLNKLCEDNGTTYKLICKCDKISYGHESKYNYYRRQNSIMKSEFKEKKLDLIEMVDQMCDYIDEHFPELYDYTFKKRVNARISILRQISESNEQKKYQNIKNDMINFIKENNSKIHKNNLFSFNEKVALLSLKINFCLFKLLWKLYSIKRYGVK